MMAGSWEMRLTLGWTSPGRQSATPRRDKDGREVVSGRAPYRGSGPFSCPYSPECVEGKFCELRQNGVLRSSRRLELLLDHRLCWLRGSYGVRVAVYDLPLAVFFWPEDHRDPKGERGDLLACSELGLWPLYPHNVGKLGRYVLRYGLKASHLAISDLRCSMLRSRGNLIPPAHGRAEGVGEGYVFSVGEDPLRRLGVPFQEPIHR